MAWLFALPLAVVAGFALQRGHICAVIAVREAVKERRYARFLSFVECAAWALIGLLFVHAMGWMALGAWPQPPSLLFAALGGALFGIGALVNGACAFGSVGRLAAGETSFLAMVPGFMLGVVVASNVGAIAMNGATPTVLLLHGPVFALLVIGLLAFALWRLWSAKRAASTPTAAFQHFTAPRWPPALAMAVIALVNVVLMLLVFAWPYTTLLIDVTLTRGMDFLVRSLIVAALVAGAFWGAQSAGKFTLRGAGVREIATRFGGGVLMGSGAAMIPGGNDALVLLGLPLLQPTALAAYAAMIAVIAAGFTLQRATTAAAA